jgi:hypothetical protein
MASLKHSGAVLEGPAAQTDGLLGSVDTKVTPQYDIELAGVSAAGALPVCPAGVDCDGSKVMVMILAFARPANAITARVVPKI